MLELRVYDHTKKRYLLQDEFVYLPGAYRATPKNTLRFKNPKLEFELSSGLEDSRNVLIYLNDLVRIVINGTPRLAKVRMIYGGLCLFYKAGKTAYHHYLGSLTQDEMESMEVLGTTHDRFIGVDDAAATR